MILNLRIKSVILGITTLLTLITSGATAGTLTISPNFKLRDIQSEAQTEAANLDISWGESGRIKSCFEFTKQVMLTNIRISQDKLSFIFAFRGSCKNFKSHYSFHLPRIGRQNGRFMRGSSEVTQPMQMTGQEYSIKRTAQVEVELPPFLQGEARKLENAEHFGVELALKLDLSSINDLMPAIKRAVIEQLENVETKIIKPLEVGPSFAGLRDPREVLSDEINKMATSTEQVVFEVTSLLQEALKHEMVMLIPEEKAHLLAFEENHPIKVNLKKANK